MSERAYHPVFPKPLDDPYFRVGEQAAQRALRNGRDQLAAARSARAILRMQPANERNHEAAVTAAAGPHRGTT